MKNLLIVCVVVVVVAGVAIGQGGLTGEDAELFAGEKIIGEKEVTAEIAITEIPEALASFKAAGFSKYVSVFGVHIVATPTARDAKLLHAAKVMAEYLDNDSDGVPDNLLVVSHLVSRNAFLIFPRTQRELREMDRSLWEKAGFHEGQLQWGDETRPGFITNGVIKDGAEQDASIEEVLHLLCTGGWSAAYPDIFGYEVGSAIGNCMDKARAGRYEEVPTGGPKAGYPEEAWYHYDDTTCNYACMVIEYMYWGVSSNLGVQDRPGRREDLMGEWEPHSVALMQSMEPCLYGLLTDSEYKIPTKAPEGRYAPSAKPTVTVPLIEYERSEVVPS